MKFFWTNFFLIGIFTTFNGCSPFGYGSLTNYVSIKSNEKLINVELPKGYCIDENAGVYTEYANTSVITNCVLIRKKSSAIFGRRPIDSIINLTHTDIKLPGSLAEKDFLTDLIRDEKLEALLTGSNSIRLRTTAKAVRNGFAVLDLQQTLAVSSVKKVRKYIFLVDQRVSIMTIITFDRRFKPEYKKFENFIKLIKRANS